MTRAHGPGESWFHGRWVRHSAAFIAAIVLNGALIVFLAAWTGRAAPVAPLLAVPLEVVPQEIEKAELATARTAEAEEIDETAPRASPPLTPLAPPAPLEWELPAAHLDPSPAGEISLSSVVSKSLTGISPELPPFAGGALGAGGLDQLPGPGSSEDLGPVLIAPPDLARYYPRRALRSGIEGTTTIRATVGADGRVSDVEVLRSTPEGVFDHAATRVGRALRFHPAVRGGRPVPVSISLDIIWKVE